MTWLGEVVSCGLVSLLPSDISPVLEESFPDSLFSLTYVLQLAFETFHDVDDVIIITGMMLMKVNFFGVGC